METLWLTVGVSLTCMDVGMMSDKLANLQLKLKQLLIRVGRYPCGSLDVQISSAGIAIADKRHMPHMPRHLSILTITPDDADPANSASASFAPWDTVRGFVNHNVSMPDFSRLTHRSSFERRHSTKRMQSGVGPLLRHRVTSDEQEHGGGLFTSCSNFCRLAV